MKIAVCNPGCMNRVFNSDNRKCLIFHLMNDRLTCYILGCMTILIYK